MFDINVVCAALANQVNALAYPPLRMLPEIEDQINPPVGIVLPARQYIDYVTTLEGADGFGGYLGTQAQTVPAAPLNFGLDIVVIQAKASTVERVSMNLNTWLGMRNDGQGVSVPAAVLRDPTLGGTVAWCLPTTADAPGPIEWGAFQFFGARIHFQLSSL